MATEKVGIYRKYRAAVPKDAAGRPLPKRKWIDKRPFSWSVRWFSINQKRHSKSFPTRREAERFAETKQQEVRLGRGDPPKFMTLKMFYQDHEALSKGKGAHSTRHMQLVTLALLAESVGWQTDIKCISMRDIELFGALRAQTGNATTTTNKEIRTLKRLFTLAVDRGYLAEGMNPVARVRMAKVGIKRKPYCSVAQFELVVGKATELLWRTLLVVFYTTGLRKREAMHLRWIDIDYAAKELHVCHRDKMGHVQKWTPKDHEMRTIPLPQQALDLLAQWQAAAPVGCPYVFMDDRRWEYYRDRAKDWNPRCDLVNNWLRRFETLCKKAGVAKLTLHDLRRSCITNWARHLAIHVTQQFAGHSDIHTTKTYYLSIQLEDIEHARKVQEKLIEGVKDAPPTDPKLTPRAKIGRFPQRKTFTVASKPPE